MWLTAYFGWPHLVEQPVPILFSRCRMQMFFPTSVHFEVWTLTGGVHTEIARDLSNNQVLFNSERITRPALCGTTLNNSVHCLACCTTFDAEDSEVVTKRFSHCLSSWMNKCTRRRWVWFKFIFSFALKKKKESFAQFWPFMFHSFPYYY